MENQEQQGFRYVTISNKAVICYNQRNKVTGSYKYSEKSKSNLKKAYGKTGLSNKSKKQIHKIIWRWNESVLLSQEMKRNHQLTQRKYLSMVTLTLPASQLESDRLFKSRYLNLFLTKLRKLYLNLNYLWVAEKQKNGNIHFHIIIDEWIAKSRLTELWNDTLANGEYINTFEKKFKHRNPPSTHIAGQKNIKDMAAYLSKYINKVDSKQAIGGKKWDCSNSLLELSSISIHFKHWFFDEFSRYAEFFRIDCYSDPFFKVFSFNKNFHKSFKFTAVYSSIIDELRPFLIRLFEPYLLKPKFNRERNGNSGPLQLQLYPAHSIPRRRNFR